MANVYHAPDMTPKSLEKPRKAPEPHNVRESTLTLEKAAANANLRLVSGLRSIQNPNDEKHPWLQPIWFVHEWGEVTGIFVEAKKVHSRDARGRKQLTFRTNEAREDLRQLLVNYYASGHAMGIGIIDFGSSRGFRLKTAQPQPTDPRRR